MTNEEKLESVKAFLNENKLKFFTNFVSRRTGRHPEVYVPLHRIMVKISEGTEKDTEFFKAVRFKYHPLFIRETETEEFVLEKMKNLIVDCMTKGHRIHQKYYDKKQNKKAK